MSAYLDASVLLPILIEEPASAKVDAYFLACGQEFLVSDFAAPRSHRPCVSCERACSRSPTLPPA